MRDWKRVALKIISNVSGMKQSFLVLMDSVVQKFRQDTVWMACVCSSWQEDMKAEVWKELRLPHSCLAVNTAFWLETLVAANIVNWNTYIWPLCQSWVFSHHRTDMGDQYDVPQKIRWNIPCVNITCPGITSHWRPTRKESILCGPRSAPTWCHLEKEEEKLPKKKTKQNKTWKSCNLFIFKNIFCYKLKWESKNKTQSILKFHLKS
jgi:hypothetical protein